MDPEAKLLRGQGVAAQRGAAWPRRRGALFRAEARQGDALRFGRLRQRGRVRRGVTVWFKGNKAGITAWSSGIRIPVSSPVISGAALRCREKGKGKGATDVWACGSVTERAGRGARTRAPCCCVGRLKRLGRARAGE